jgi:N-methylhydantoinase A/oxoprolinase/acetone carboxylase beta subunit
MAAAAHLLIGAGGGSIAHVDSGGTFKVGPQSAARDTWVGGYPVIVPMIDIHTISAAPALILAW